MNILLINHYAGSSELGMEFRPYYLAKEWIKAGHKVLIVGGTYSHLRKFQPEEGWQNIDGVDYLWLKTNAYKGNGVFRLISMLYFVFQLFRNTKKLRAFSPDAVIASSTYPLDIYPAHYIAKKEKAKLVFEIHDLWPLSPIELAGMSKYHPFIMLIQSAENYAYKHCDRCISILPCVHEHVKAHGLDLKKMYLVSNGIVEKDWLSPVELSLQNKREIDALKAEGCFLIGYVGAHAISNALDTLLDAAKILMDEKIKFVLVGKGQEKERLQKRVKEENISNVIFLDPISKSQIPSLLSEFDVLYVGLQNTPLYRFGVGLNKIFDYMMTGKPIIQSFKAGNDLVAEARCGISIPGEDVKAIQKAIMTLKSLSKEEREELGRNGKIYVMKDYVYSSLAKKFINAIK